jgi:hypothetical protein
VAPPQPPSQRFRLAEFGYFPSGVAVIFNRPPKAATDSGWTGWGNAILQQPVRESIGFIWPARSIPFSAPRKALAAPLDRK